MQTLHGTHRNGCTSTSLCNGRSTYRSYYCTTTSSFCDGTLLVSQLILSKQNWSGPLGLFVRESELDTPLFLASSCVSVVFIVVFIVMFIVVFVIFVVLVILIVVFVMVFIMVFVVVFVMVFIMVFLMFLVFLRFFGGSSGMPCCCSPKTGSSSV